MRGARGEGSFADGHSALAGAYGLEADATAGVVLCYRALLTVSGLFCRRALCADGRVQLEGRRPGGSARLEGVALALPRCGRERRRQWRRGSERVGGGRRWGESRRSALVDAFAARCWRLGVRDRVRADGEGEGKAFKEGGAREPGRECGVRVRAGN